MTRSPARPSALFVLLLALAPALAACQTDGPGASLAQAAPPAPKPLTHQQAALQCWMSIEKGRKDLPLDARADIVTHCIDKKMKSAQPAPQG